MARARENRKHRKRRLQKMEVKSGSRRKFWEGATKKNNYCNIFFILLFWNWASGISKWYKFEENDIFWGLGCTFWNLFGRKFCPKKTPLADNLKFSRALALSSSIRASRATSVSWRPSASWCFSTATSEPGGPLDDDWMTSEVLGRMFL